MSRAVRPTCAGCDYFHADPADAKNGWCYVLNAAARPIVGRWYARMRLSGITPTVSGAQPAWRPDFSTLS